MNLRILGRTLFFSTLLCLSAADSHAQAKLIPRPAPAPEYTLGAGDQILIHIVDMDEISDKPVRIDPNGFVDLPLIGRVQAGGLTLDAFKQELTVKAAKYVNSPQISVAMTDNQSRPVSIIGEVNAPGVHQLQGPKRLIEVISLAGGAKPDAGPKVIVTRQMKWGAIPLPDAKTDLSNGFSRATVSLDELLNSTNPSENIVVEPNDVISIPRADVIYVVGNVKKAGGFQLSSHGTFSIVQAVSLAEGMSTDAAGGSAKIIRPAPGGDGKPKEIPVNVYNVFAGKDPDVPMYANDVLFIPNSLAKSTLRRSAEAVLQITTGLLIYKR
jgi:polysaccharide export outer membrane protein